MGLVDFEIEKESWTVVELEDQTIIRMRPVLLFLEGTALRARKSRVRRGMKYTVQFGVRGTKKGRPYKGPLTSDVIQKNIVKRNLTFRFLRRGESLYQAKGGNIRLVATPTQFDKSRLFDSDGERVYWVTHETSAALALGIAPTGK